MPKYDYRCTECEERFEVERSMSDRSEQTCPSCGSPAKKLFGAVGVAFKGSGFHNTDYKPRAKESESAPAACPSAKSDSGCAGCPAAAQ